MTWSGAGRRSAGAGGRRETFDVDAVGEPFGVGIAWDFVRIEAVEAAGAGD